MADGEVSQALMLSILSCQEVWLLLAYDYQVVNIWWGVFTPVSVFQILLSGCFREELKQREDTGKGPALGRPHRVPLGDD